MSFFTKERQLAADRYSSVISRSNLKLMFKEHFENKKNTELAGIDLIEINKIVNDYCDTEIYSDFISFMKKNKIFGNKNLEYYINKLSY